MTNMERFLAVLDKQKMNYTRSGERTLYVITPEACKNVGYIEVITTFDMERPGDVQLFIPHLGKFARNKQTVGMATCNALNEKYRWVNFHINSYDEGCARCDFVLHGANAGKECLELLLRMVRIVDEAYPDLMNALYCQ